MYWVGIRDMAVWLTLYDYHDHHDLDLISLGDIFMHCEGLHDQLFVGRPIKVDMGCVIIVSMLHTLSSWMNRGVL